MTEETKAPEPKAPKASKETKAPADEAPVEGSPLAPEDADQLQGEAFTPEQVEQIQGGEYPTPKQLTPEEREAAAQPKPELQKEQEERIEDGTQGA